MNPNNTTWPSITKLISVVILTKNEAHHIARCISSAKLISENIYVIDSDSADGTPEIASRMGVNVINYAAKRYSDKLNWVLQNLQISTPWVMRMDADETLHKNLLDSSEILKTLGNSRVSGVYIRRQLWFMGKWIKHGGIYPTWSMRFWRHGSAKCEMRDTDEHMILLSGEYKFVNHDIIDNPLTDLSAWIQKHNNYSSLEAKNFLVNKEFGSIKGVLLGNHIERVRWFKDEVYHRLPLFVRPFLYFIYRYILKLGFLDGFKGFLFHFLHAFWYRLIVDAKVFEQASQLNRKALVK